MSKRRREAETGGAAAEAAELDTVFVDTNLGTHLAMLICSSDTASDFKKKVAMEHKKCFPEIGEIEVHSVKVKRRSNYYHLPDIMHVRSAFHGVKRNWFLSVDASNIPTLPSNINSVELGTSSGLNIGMTDVDNDCQGFVSDERKNEIPLALLDGAAEKIAVSETNSEPMVIKPVEKTTDSPVKKKRKVRHIEDAGLEDGNALFHPSGKDGKVSGVRNDQDDVEGRLVSEGTSLPSVAEKTNLGSNLDSQNLNSSNRTNEDCRFESMVDYGLGKDVHPLGAVSAAVPGSSARMMDAGGEGGDVNTAASKRKKKKKTVAKIQDMEQIEKGETKKPHTETMRSEEKGETKKPHTEHHKDVALPSDSNYPDNVGPDLAEKETSVMRDADAVMEPEISSSIKKKKKKRERKSVSTNVENQGITEIHKGIGGTFDLPSPSGDHIPKETGKDESIRLNERKVVEMKLLDASNCDDQQKVVWEVNRKEADVVEAQNEQTLENVSLQNEMMMEKTKSSAGDCHAEFPTAETEHSIMKWNQADKDNENTRKKKRGKKPIGTNKENSGTAEIQNGIKGSLDLPSPSGDHIPKATGKDKSISLNEGKDVEMKFLDASNHEQEKVWEVNRKEADLVESQTLEDVSVRNKMTTEKTQSSAGNGHAGLPDSETENALMESNQVDMDNENTENKSKKSMKKRRKQKDNATDGQENLPGKDQQVGIEALATKETSVFANSELEGRYVDSSQVLSRRSEEKVDKMHELVLNTDGLAENSGKGEDSIDFKQYFVGDQLKNKVDSSDKVRKVTKSKRSSTKVKVNDEPSVNIPSEVQNSIKSSENKDTVRTKCVSAHNSDRGEMSPNSFKRSSKTTKKEKNESSLLGCNVSSYPSLDKSTSERSETLHNLRRSNRLLGPNVSTPKKKIELATSGGIFQDNSGESSGDENGTMHSYHRTISPSDSSSMSGDSEEESELSQNSTSYGSNDAKAKSTSKIDSPESTELSLDVIAKGTKTFKKAIKVAEVEYVPESQL